MPDTALPTLSDIRAAAAEIAGVVIRTPFLPSPRLSQATGADIWVKYENLQATASFKERGALIKMLALTPEERARGVIAMSAGNHAQAVAWHAQRLGLHATIVMPAPTPFVKIAATRSFGAEVVLAGETLADCQATVEARIADSGAVLVHPYDDPHVIAGQGTVGLEIIADQPALDAVIVPVGGGGLISGIAIAVKALKPAVQVIGVESEVYPSMWAALRGEAPKIGSETLAEGIAVKNVGRLTLEAVRRHVDDMVLVGEGSIEQAVAAYLMLQKTMAEGAGAAGLAAVLSDPRPLPRQARRLDPGRRQYRPAARRLDHGARTGARAAGGRHPRHHPRPAGRAGRDRPHHRRGRRQHPRRLPPPHHAVGAAEGRRRRRHHGNPRSRPCRRDHRGADRPRLRRPAPGYAVTTLAPNSL